jgi:hypothetical protein
MDARIKSGHDEFVCVDILVFRHTSPFPRRNRTRVIELTLGIERAQGMPGAPNARSLVCENKKHTSVITTVTPEPPGIPRAMVLTTYSTLFPAIGLFVTVIGAMRSIVALTSASRRQNHVASPYTSQALVCRM